MTDLMKISDSLSLPLDTVTDTIGVLAVKGAGKTYTFLVIVEEMIRHNIPVVVLDPVGVCWGLRSGADGKGTGLPVVIVGGQHGDIPLKEGAGVALADWVIAERRAAVFDLSELPTKAASFEVTGGTFRTYLGVLRRNGLISEANGGASLALGEALTRAVA